MKDELTNANEGGFHGRTMTNDFDFSTFVGSSALNLQSR